MKPKRGRPTKEEPTMTIPGMQEPTQPTQTPQPTQPIQVTEQKQSQRWTIEEIATETTPMIRDNLTGEIHDIMSLLVKIANFLEDLSQEE